MILPIILAGGFGNRLWPVSRRKLPKQFLNFYESKSLFQRTLERAVSLENSLQPILVVNKDHLDIASHQLKEIDIDLSFSIVEPVARNTAPAILISALQSLEINEDPTLIIFPSDHLIKDSKAFKERLEIGIEFAEQGNLVTFGIEVDRPETQYGYFKISEEETLTEEFLKVDSFVEKPNQEEAKKFLNSGNYLWNSGIFVIKSSLLFSEAEKYCSELFYQSKEVLKTAVSKENIIFLSLEAFEKLSSESIDYAFLEKISEIYCLPLKTDWMDAGNWTSIWEEEKKDKDGNVIIGNVISSNNSNSYLRAESRLLFGSGLKNMVVVETKDAVLVSEKEELKDIKNKLKKLYLDKMDEVMTSVLVHKPWGNFESLIKEEAFQVKRICVFPNQSLSLQSHKKRSEHWIVVKGEAKVQIENDDYILNAGESIFIPLGAKHRLSNVEKEELEIIEIQYGSYLEEDDIVRYTDNYGREE